MMNKKFLTIPVVAALGGGLGFWMSATPAQSTQLPPKKVVPKAIKTPNIVMQACEHERAMLPAIDVPRGNGQVYAKLACSNPFARVASGGCMLQAKHRDPQSWAISGSFPFEGGNPFDGPESGEPYWETENSSGWVCTADKKSEFQDKPAKIAVAVLCCR